MDLLKIHLHGRMIMITLIISLQDLGQLLMPKTETFLMMIALPLVIASIK